MILERIQIIKNDEELQNIISSLNDLKQDGNYGFGFETEHFVFEFICNSEDIENYKNLLAKAIKEREYIETHGTILGYEEDK